ncbi:polyamine oxidase [Rhizobiaceae bacterium]|nr:polyamine oxidase [Rhizobiaceae bacterium]
MTISRRTLLAAPLALAMAPAHAAPPRRAAVIGAGIAGLACARRLAGAGFETVVLEARDRIGGRILTDRRWSGRPVDLGASWIHGASGNPVTALAREAGARRVATSYEASVAYGPDGGVLDIDADVAGMERLIEEARDAAGDLDADVSLKEAIEAHPRYHRLDERGLMLLAHVVNAQYELEYAGDWSELSAWSLDEDSGFGGADVLFPDGYDVVPAFMARGLDIRLGAAVAAVSTTGKAVTVRLVDGQAVAADHVVVTVPLGVLKEGRIAFAPALPAAHREAIEKLGFGILEKCCLRFGKPFWPRDVDWIEFVSGRRGEWSEWLSLARATGASVLVGFNGGAYGRALGSLDDGAVVDAALKALRAMFGPDVPAPLGSIVTRWAADPFARGAYSFNAVGSDGAMRRALAEPVDDRLFFAGEATSADYFATTHGAYLSGIAAADAILSA